MNIVTLIEELVNGLIAAEDIFFQNPKDFYSLEKSVKSTCLRCLPAKAPFLRR